MPVLDSLLIANRGEIACRVMRTARRMGIRTLAVFHHEDRGAPHVTLADQAVEITAETPSGAYLDGTRIIEAARRLGAAAIHPGYGFLAENAEFAAAVRAAGLVFVGPRPETVALMGEKVDARELAKRAGIPVAPAVTHAGDDGAFCEEASAMGFPLLIKAAAGGGGRGMGVVQDASELGARVRRATEEARRYFGDGRIYAEPYFDDPRHVEVQIVGDGEGGVVHLFERDCSVQRRFQKIIEEAPAPRLDAALRARLCDAAVHLASEARYLNAGTVEFLVTSGGAWYFLEMNTRLQVEHPVTELVCGIDLVEAQLRVAAGEGLPWRQHEIACAGHAIECRICCEEPEHDFRPAVGRVRTLQAPHGDGIRFDGGIALGQRIGAGFDSMVGKLVCHGADRSAAIETTLGALRRFVLLGVSHNIDYLAAVVDHEAFRRAELHTGFLARHAAALRPAAPAGDDEAALLIAAALGVDEFRRLVYDTPQPYAAMGGWRN